MERLLTDIAFAAIFAVLGIVLFVLAFVVIDWLTPGEMWTEIIEKRNTALGVMMGAVGIALAIIIAASIH